MSVKIASIIRAQFFLIITVLAFVGVISLYFYAMSIEPKELSIGNIGWDDAGLTVSTRGFIKDVRLSEALYITLLDIESPDSILVYVPKSAYQALSFKSDLLPGAELKVKGEVKEYNGRLELFVRSSRNLALLSKPKELELELEVLAKSPELFRGLNVSVEGTVTSIVNFYDSNGAVGTSLTLKNGNYSLMCIAYGTALNKDVIPGYTITFKGTFEYHETRLGWFLVDRRYSARP